MVAQTRYGSKVKGVTSHDDLLDAAAFGTAYLLDTREPRVW
jgi:hypothetical protein